METQKKTLKLKRDTEPETEGGVPGASGPLGLMPPGSNLPPKRTSHTVAAVLALIAVILFVGLIGIQLMEMSYYKAPPSAFPQGLSALPPPAPSPAAPAVESEPEPEPEPEDEPEPEGEPEESAEGSEPAE